MNQPLDRQTQVPRDPQTLLTRHKRTRARGARALAFRGGGPLLPSPSDRAFPLRVIRGRLPAIGMPNADILNHGPPPAYARPSGRGRGRAVAAGATQRPASLRALRAAAGL